MFAVDPAVCRNRWLADNHMAMGIASLVLHVINLLLAYVFFCRRTNFYSDMNNGQKAFFTPTASTLGKQGEGQYSISVKETQKGIWQIEGNPERQFNLSGYLCPKAYICAYFIRQLHYVAMNRRKDPIIKLFSSLDLRSWEKYNFLEIQFHSKGKTKRKTLVRDYKTKTTWLIRLIIRARYYIDFMFGLSIGALRKTHVCLSEEKYLQRALV